MKLTHEDFHALLCIETGADVYDRRLADSLEALQAKAARLITIRRGEAKVHPSSQPVFFATCTELGRKAIEQYLRSLK
jgi:hypothetical protein